MDEKYYLSLFESINHHLYEMQDSVDQEHLDYHIERVDHYLLQLKSLVIVTPKTAITDVKIEDVTDNTERGVTGVERLD